jgi:ubiquinone/menaquinone biosynthesis C-methylase UbiE
MVRGASAALMNPCDPQTVANLLEPLIKPDARVADVGCGRGATLAWLSKHFGYALFGAEPDRFLYDEARVNCPAATIVCAGADDLPFADEAFDAVLMECAFSLVERPAVAAGEISRIISRQGVFLLTDLFTQTEEDIRIENNELFRFFYTKHTCEMYFEKSGFVLESFLDQTAVIRSMIAQMLMDGKEEGFVGDEARALLRQVKARYGIWVYRKI